jgi:hypothetical protein
MSATLIMFSPKCAHCGEDLPRSASFCVTCGKPFHTSNESTKPPAEIRPIRPINDSIRLPAPPKISSLVPIPENEEGQNRDDSWREEEPLEKSGSSLDESAISQDLSNTSMNLDGDLLPTEHSKRPWMYAAAAAAFLLLLISWPRAEKKSHPMLAPQEPEHIEEATSLPIAPTSLALEPTPQPFKVAPKNLPNKTQVASKPEAPKAEPTKPGLLGALKAQEANKAPDPKPEPAPPKIEPKTEPKTDVTNNAANEAAGFLDEN